METMKALLVLLLTFALTNAQENAGTSIAPSLLQCYNSTQYLKFNLPPTSVSVLIDLIRKVEDGRSTQDARQFSIEILQRFRQDGITKFKQDIPDQHNIIAYSPTQFQKEKNKIILGTLIPGDAVNFPNETLNTLEQCAFHVMISNTILKGLRGDESSTCGRIGRYTVRAKREDTNTTKDLNVDDVDVVMPRSEGTSYREFSNCPLEFGAVYDKRGAVQMGTVLAGIAAGLNEQNIPIDSNVFDNRYASTLSGDLVEAALFQPGVAEIGSKGAFNSTLVPSYYFIEKDDKNKYFFTDAEVRASLDGLILALKMKDITSKYSNIKVSQILDMYYSSRGVFSQDIRACNRVSAYKDLVNVTYLQQQTNLFGQYYNSKVTLQYSPSRENIEENTRRAIDNFVQYLGSLGDLNCNVDKQEAGRGAADLIVVLDTNWRYEVIQPALAYLMDEIDLDRFGSNVTIINGIDGRVILSSINNRLDFYEGYNRTIHQAHPAGFDFPKMFNTVEGIVREHMQTEKSKVGSLLKSMVTLFVPVNVPSDNDKTVIANKKEYYKSYLPDLKVIVLGQGGKDSYNFLVTDTSADIYTLPDNTADSIVKSAMQSLALRIKQIPRVIRNTNCDEKFSGGSESKSFVEYVEVGTTNLYKVAPQYFYGDGDRDIKVRGQGFGSLSVCWSRDLSALTGDGGGTCKSVNSDEFKISLAGLCNTDESVSSCRSVFVAVSANGTAANSNPRCTDKNCRFPDNLKYTISTDTLACKAGVMQAIANAVLVLSALALIAFNMF